MNPTIRPARVADSLFIWRLSMLDDVRAMSTRSERFTFQEHERWYREKLVSIFNSIWVVEGDETPLGYVRYGRDGLVAEVAIAIMPDARRNGLAKDLLLTTEPWALRNLEVSRLLALVLVENEPSQRLFSSAGYAFDGFEERMGKQHQRWVK